CRTLSRFPYFCIGYNQELLSCPTRRSSDLEEPSWSATDSGGDGLAIYRNTGDELVFRLWESKWHGTQDSARDTARKAANQIRLKDRKSTRLNSSHVKISYAVFCLKKKMKIQ